VVRRIAANIACRIAVLASQAEGEAATSPSHGAASVKIAVALSVHLSGSLRG